MLTEPLSYADIDSIQHLIYRAWGANAHQFKDDAFNFLLREPPPFHCATGTNPYGATRELIAALQAVAPRQRLYELQEYIARFVPAWERTPEGRGRTASRNGSSSQLSMRADCRHARASCGAS